MEQFGGGRENGVGGGRGSIAALVKEKMGRSCWTGRVGLLTMNSWEETARAANHPPLPDTALNTN